MPGWAPTGSYSLRFEGTTPGPCANDGPEPGSGAATSGDSCVLLCVDVWFTMCSGQGEEAMQAAADDDEHEDDHFDDLDEHFEL